MSSERLRCGWLIVLVLLGGSFAAAQPGDPRFATFAEVVDRAAAPWRVPGLAMVVIEDDQVVFEHTLGTTRLGADASMGAVDRETLFSIGSTTKAFAAASLGILVDRGHLTWDTPVRDVLPWFRLSDEQQTARLRVRDLLTHNAGLPNTDVLWYQQKNSLDEILRLVRHAPMESVPYTNFTYQNVMYAAAGRVVEEVTGVPWAEFVEREIFAPLGMNRSAGTLEAASRRRNVAAPHFLIDGEVEVIDNASVDPVAAAGSIWSSIADLSHWLRFLLRGCELPDGTALLEPSTCSEIFEPQTIIRREMYPVMRLYDHKWFTYGLGWFQTDYRGQALDFHSGSIDGLVALAGLRRDRRQGVFILANLDHAEVRHALLLAALDRLDSTLAVEERRDWPGEVWDLFDSLRSASAGSLDAGARPEVDPDEREMRSASHYAGTYVDPLAGEIVISLRPDAPESGELHLDWGLRRCALRHVGGDSFHCTWEAEWRGETALTFSSTPDGTVARLTMGGADFWRRHN